MSKLKLFPYQLEAVDWCEEHEKVCAILAYDMGLGKTIVSCALLLQKPIQTMIMVPTSLIDQWKNEIIHHTPGLSVSIYHSSTRKTFVNDADVIITTTSIIANDINLGINHFQGIKRLIIDEAHKLRNRKGKTYQKLSLFVNKIPNKVFLTGTPICNKPDDIISLICLSNLDIYNSLGYWRYKNYKVKNTILKNILPEIMLRKTQAETISSILPSITHRDIVIKLEEGEQMNTYNHYVNDNMTLRRILRMRQSLNDHHDICKKSLILNEISVKMDAIDNILKTIDEDDKVIIFSSFTSVLIQLYERLSKSYTSEEIFLYHGGINLQNRNIILSNFKSKDKSKLILINLKSGGCGLNLVEANHVILIEPYWNDSEPQQAINRVYRLGQKKEVYVYRLIVNNSIETWLLKLQELKKNISKIFIDNNKEEKVNDLLKQKNDIHSIFKFVGYSKFSKDNDKVIETLLAEIEM
jgi:SNF2 family DNA or RNA helicase